MRRFFVRVRTWRHAPDQRPAWHFHNQILSGWTIHAFAHAVLAILSDETRLIVLADQVIQIVVSLQDHVTTAAAVAAARTALGPIFLALERNAAFAAVSRAGVDFYFIDKHAK